MTLKLVIFDCDGVLVDTETPVNHLLSANLTRHGLNLSPKRCEELFTGRTLPLVFDDARRRGADLPDTWIDAFYEEMFERLALGVPTIPGVLDLIANLEARGIAIWVASNGPKRKMQLSLGPSGLWQRFAGRIMSREDFAPKPAPDMLLHAVRKTGVGLENAVMVDDSVSGCLAARNAGVRCIGFADRGQDDTLRATGAEPVGTMAEVSKLLGL